jgi:hypothetical protein
MNNLEKAGKRWSPEDDKKLRIGIKQKKSTERIAEGLGRTPTAVRNRASKLRESLKPPDSRTHK